MAGTIKPESDMCVRGLFDTIEVREVDNDSRTATFVAATENGVDTLMGREYLRMSGGDFGRYRRNPVVLDTHNRYEAGAVIGRARISTKNRELIAEVTFADTERAEEVWQLVRTGFLKALSIGFLPHDVQRVEEGESSGTGANRIEGPARIVKKWELYEISVVPVPADAESLRRSFLHGEEPTVLSEVRSLVRALNRVFEEISDMSKSEKETAPAAQKTKTDADDAQEKETRTVVSIEERELEVRRRDILAIAPESMRGLAEQCILEGLSLEDARKRMLEEHAKLATPAGTQSVDVLKTGNAQDDDDGNMTVDDVSDRDFVRSLCG